MKSLILLSVLAFVNANKYCDYPYDAWELVEDGEIVNSSDQPALIR